MALQAAIAHVLASRWLQPSEELAVWNAAQLTRHCVVVDDARRAEAVNAAAFAGGRRRCVRRRQLQICERCHGYTPPSRLPCVRTACSPSGQQLVLYTADDGALCAAGLIENGLPTAGQQRVMGTSLAQVATRPLAPAGSPASAPVLDAAAIPALPALTRVCNIDVHRSGCRALVAGMEGAHAVVRLYDVRDSATPSAAAAASLPDAQVVAGACIRLPVGDVMGRAVFDGGNVNHLGTPAAPPPAEHANPHMIAIASSGGARVYDLRDRSTAGGRAAGVVDGASAADAALEWRLAGSVGVPRSFCRAVALLESHNLLAVGADGGFAAVFDLRRLPLPASTASGISHACEPLIRLPHVHPTGFQQEVRAISLLPCGRAAVTGCYDGSVRLWDLDHPRVRACAPAPPARPLARGSAGVSSAGKILALHAEAAAAAAAAPVAAAGMVSPLLPSGGGSGSDGLDDFMLDGAASLSSGPATPSAPVAAACLLVQHDSPIECLRVVALSPPIAGSGARGSSVAPSLPALAVFASDWIGKLSTCSLRWGSAADAEPASTCGPAAATPAACFAASGASPAVVPPPSPLLRHMLSLSSPAVRADARCSPALSALAPAADAARGGRCCWRGGVVVVDDLLAPLLADAASGGVAPAAAAAAAATGTAACAAAAAAAAAPLRRHAASAPATLSVLLSLREESECGHDDAAAGLTVPRMPLVRDIQPLLAAPIPAAPVGGATSTDAVLAMPSVLFTTPAAPSDAQRAEAGLVVLAPAAAVAAHTDPAPALATDCEEEAAATSAGSDAARPHRTQGAVWAASWCS